MGKGNNVAVATTLKSTERQNHLQVILSHITSQNLSILNSSRVFILLEEFLFQDENKGIDMIQKFVSPKGNENCIYFSNYHCFSSNSSNLGS